MAVPQFPIGVRLPDGRWIEVGDTLKRPNDPLHHSCTKIEYISAGSDETFIFTVSDGTEIVVELDHAMDVVNVYRQPR